MSEKMVTIREIARAVGVCATDPAYVATVESVTVYAVQLGYPMNAGTGGAYADHCVTQEHAAVIMDMLVRTDADGVYTGDRGAIAALAAGDPQEGDAQCGSEPL